MKNEITKKAELISDKIIISETEKNNIIKELKNRIKNSEKVEITSEYMEFEPGEEINMCYVGTVNIKTQDNSDAQAIKFIAENGGIYINANTMLVNNISNLPLGTYINVLCTGTQKSASGTYKTFKISVLV